MGWPDRMPEDLEVLAAAPGDDGEEIAEYVPIMLEVRIADLRPSASASSGTASPTSSQASSSASSTSTSGTNVPTGVFDVEGSDPSASETETETPNGARQTAYVGYAGVAAAAIGFAIL